MPDAILIHANSGKTPLFGFDEATEIENLTRDSEDEVQTGERDELIGEDDTTQVVVFSDRGVQVPVSGSVRTGFVKPAIGAPFTAGGIAGYIVDSAKSCTSKLNRWRGTVELPDSISAVS
jgi:hypothetical protein